MKKTATGLLLVLFITSCSVQHFPVNTQVEPFEYCGRFLGENTKGKKFTKSGDLHVLGFNVKKSNTQKMAEDLGATAYTIETKSNLYVNILTWGMADYKVVKVIKRDR